MARDRRGSFCRLLNTRAFCNRHAKSPALASCSGVMVSIFGEWLSEVIGMVGLTVPGSGCVVCSPSAHREQECTASLASAVVRCVMRGVSCRHLVWRQCVGGLKVWRLTPRVGVSLPSAGSDQHQLAATSPPCARMRYGVGTIACLFFAECDAGERSHTLLLLKVVPTKQLRRPTGTG